MFHGGPNDGQPIDIAVTPLDATTARIDLDQPFTKEFEGMTKARVNLDDLLETRERLVADIRSRLDEKARMFLLSLHDGTPDFDAIERPRAADLPAVRWKLINLEKLKRDNLACQ